MFIKGRILSSYGVIGYAKIKNVSNSSNDFLKLKSNKVVLKRLNSNLIETKVDDVKIRENGLFLKFDQVDTPEKVKSLIGYELWVDDELASSLEDDDEYYFGELIGFKIINKDNEVIADVVSFIDAGNSVLLEVAKENKIFLLPFSSIYLGEINKNNKTIELKVLELLE